jgi:TolB-like protein/Flp pilus assembly protein TadD
MAVYRFDRFALDLGRGALLAGDVECPLRPKSFALLKYFVENAGRLISRDEIMKAVWPGVLVTEDSIAQCVMEIRRTLGDEEQRLLRTLPRRGFLFAAERPHTETPAADVPPVPDGDPAEAVPRPPTGRPMVVVYPFDSLDGNPERAYFADGLTADLVTDMTRFQSLHVVSPHRRAWRSAAGQPETPWASPTPPPGAGYLVNGSVRLSGDAIRVTAQLGDAQNGAGLWADRFDRRLDDLFSVQEEVADRLAAHLVSHVELERIRRSRRRPPSSLDAYDLCLRGRELHHRATEADTLAARTMFDRAIAADPEYAPAYAWQAFTVQRGYTHLWGEPRGRAAANQALQLARRAVELEPGSALCLARLAFILLLNASWDEALELGRAAVMANPCDGEARYSYAGVLAAAGDPAMAVREFRLAISLDPFERPALRALLGRALLLSGSREEALAELRYAAARLPTYGPGLQMLVIAAAEAGQMDEAGSALRRLMSLGPYKTTQGIRDTWFFRDPQVVERFSAAIDSVGLPG